MEKTIGKLTIKSMDVVLDWYKSPESKNFFNGNWSDAHPLWEKSDKIGFYNMISQIPDLRKALDNMDNSYIVTEKLYNQHIVNTDLKQSFNLIHYDPRFVVFCDHSYSYILPAHFCNISMFEDYENVSYSDLVRLGGTNEGLFPALAKDKTIYGIKADM